MDLFVNGEKIEQDDITAEVERLKPDYQACFTDQPPEEQETQLLEWSKENVLERVLLSQAAKNDPRTVAADKIDQAFQALLESYGGEEEFYKNTHTKPEDQKQIKADLELQMRIERLVEEQCKDLPTPDEEQARKFYQQNKDQFITPEQVRAAHIVKHVDEATSPEEAHKAILKVQEDLKAGKSFEQLADENSDCPGNGGDLGFFPRGEMVQEFEDVVFSMQKGQISDIIETNFGFHIAKLYDKLPVRAVPFDKIKDKILERLVEEQKTKKIEDYLDELKEKAVIEEK